MATDEIRVLHVLGEIRASGAERMLESASQDFARLGARSAVLGLGAEHPYAERLVRAGYLVRAPRLGSPVSWLPEVFRSIRALRPKVIHVHPERGFIYVCMAARLAAPRARLLRTVHSRFEYEGLHVLKRRLAGQLARRLGTVWVAISKPVADNERERFKMRAELVQNWADVAKIVSATSRGNVFERRRALGLPLDRTLVVAVGNCGHAKNHEILLAALARLPEAFVVCHVGSERGAGEEERSLLSAYSTDRLIRLGMRDDVEDILAACDIFVMPSRYEGFGLSAVEAVCAGLRTVVTDTPGLAWLEDYGASVCAADAESLAHAIVQCAEESVETMNVQRCRRDFSSDRGAAEYMALYGRRTRPLGPRMPLGRHRARAR